VASSSITSPQTPTLVHNAQRKTHRAGISGSAGISPRGPGDKSNTVAAGSSRSSGSSGSSCSSSEVGVSGSGSTKTVVQGEDNDRSFTANDDQSDQTGYYTQRALLLGVAILWGTNFPSVKYLLDQGLTPDIICAGRFLIAGASLLPFTLNSITREIGVAGAEIGMWISLGYISQAISLQSVSSNKAAFVCSLQVIVVPLIEILFGKKPSAKLLAAALMSLIGVALLELSPDNQLTPPDINDFICFLQPLSFGISYIRIEKYLETLPKGAAKALSGVQVQVTALVSLIWALALHFTSGNAVDVSFLQDKYSLLALLHTGLFSTALTVYITNVALKEVPASESSVIIGTEPLWAAVFAAWILGESLSTGDAAGGMLILAGCFLGTQASSARKTNDGKLDG